MYVCKIYKGMTVESGDYDEVRGFVSVHNFITGNSNLKYLVDGNIVVQDGKRFVAIIKYDNGFVVRMEGKRKGNKCSYTYTRNGKSYTLTTQQLLDALKNLKKELGYE